MIMTNKLLPVALIAALVGGSVGALVMHSRNQSNTAAATTERAAVPSTVPSDATYVADRQVPVDPYMPAQFDTAEEQGAYKVGFADGFRAAQAGAVGTVAPATLGYAPRRTAYRRSYAHSTSSRSYSTYQPRSRSFWQKHRDKLTVAIGAGSGAAIGGLIGGKKGAAIGALAGGGGSALYTYKLRNRTRRY
jgi:hypothetical protein